VDVIKGSSMKICWVISEQTEKKVTEVDTLKGVAPTWGSCIIHSMYSVDNIVCTDLRQSKQLINYNVQDSSNFYLSADNYKTLGNPVNVKVYQGQFGDANINNKDDIVALNVVMQSYDIILLLGFKFSKSKSKDNLEKHKQKAYLHNIKTIITENTDKQFVLVNYRGKLSNDFNVLENLTRDSLTNVLKLAKQI
jgi:glycyl-tRNA synthetase alpha subunit